jgi:sugar lactone lactonase YvrE
MKSKTCILIGITFAWAGILAVQASAPPLPYGGPLPQEKTIGKIEPMAAFNGAMPTGVAVSIGRRVFVCFPRWGDSVPFTVAEIKNGQPSPYPNQSMNNNDPAHASAVFVSAQSVVVDALDRLWVLDTGSIEFQPVLPGGPKLVGIDLTNNRIIKVISFPPSVVLPTTYLNDVRIDLRRRSAGVAYITDSSDKGPNGIIVVDLDSGKSWRRLNDHPSTKAETNFLAFVEGEPLMQRKAGQPPQYLKIGSDGIALSDDGQRLYYCPLASRRLYSVSAEALASDTLPEQQVAATVIDEGMKPASDGLEADSEGRIYATDYEQGAIVRRKTDGTYECVMRDARALWPDTLSLAGDGYLYFIANQLHRQPSFRDGKDERQKPYTLFRVQVAGAPVRLRR